MAPVKPHEQESRRAAATDVLALAERGFAAGIPDARAMGSLSIVKGLFNRVVREDQWDWFTVWMQMGRLNPRLQLRPASEAIAAMRNAIKEHDSRAMDNAREVFARGGGLHALRCCADGSPMPHQYGLAYVFVLSRPADPRNLLVGYTAEDIFDHVGRINANGDPTALRGVRAVWVVKADEGVAATVAAALDQFRVSDSRDTYDVDISVARRAISSVIHEVKAGTAEVSAAAIARQAARSRAEQPLHPEARAAEIRRRVVQRDESDWAHFGFSDDERSRWITAGIPGNRAHWAAMCQDSMRRANPILHITPSRLRQPINASGDTPLDALANGQNTVRIQARLASAAGLVGVPGVPVPLLAVTAEAFMPLYTEIRKAAAELKETVARALPTRLPSIARQIDDLERRARGLWDGRLALAREIDAYKAGKGPGSLLSAFARAHGVHHDGPELRSLSDAVAGSLAELENAVRATSLVGRAARSGNYLYLAPDAVAAASDYRYADEEFRDSRRSPYPVDPRGFALIAATEGPDDDKVPARFLAWEVDGERINAVLLARGQVASSLLDKTKGIGLLESWHPRDGLDRTDGPVRHVRLLNDLARIAHEAQRQRNPAIGPLRGRSEEDAGTVLVYNTMADGSGIAHDRRTPDHRWRVRGHWRRQWYPSENTHRIIWIDEHTSGSSDRPLIQVDRVRAVRA